MMLDRSWIFSSFCLAASAISWLATLPNAAADETSETRIVFIAGRPSHGYGSHEHYAGSRLLADTLQNAGLGITTEVYRGWPSDESVLDSADAIVVYCDGGGGHVVLPHREKMQKLIDAGKGFVCLHYAVEVPKGQPGDDFLNWLGGYFETHWSVNPHWEADYADLPESPVTRGVKPFKANDEWYFHMRFRPQMQGVTSILHAVAPESTMRRPDGPHSGNPDVRKAVAAGTPQTTAWIFERPDGGRSFSFTGGHFHWNWGRPDVLRLVSNAIAWTAKVEVPSDGVSLEPVPFKRLEADQDYEKPNNFDPRKTAEEFHLTSRPLIGVGRGLARESVDERAAGGQALKLFASDIVTSKTPNHQVKIRAELKGAKDLFLVATDGGDGFSCDWANWVEPKLVGPKGELSLLSLDWKSATSDWGQVRKNRNVEGRPMTVMGKAIDVGIGTHANSVIHFQIPDGYDAFEALGALDSGGTRQNNGQQTSVQFMVYSGSAPTGLKGASGADNPARAAENALAGLEIPEDLQATLVASEPDLNSLTNLDIDDKGRIWVIDVVNYRGNNGKRPEGDRILILEDLDQDGVADEMKVFYQGRDIDSAMGICVLGNEVIVSVAPNILKFIDEDGDDVADKKVAMFTETGQPQHDHSNHSFLFGPDGKLYWNVGNTGRVVKDADGKVVVDIHGREIIDNGKPFYGGMPFRCDLDGSNMEVLAHNFRNNWETTVDSFGTLWQSDNDDDGNRGVRINFVMEHGNYGYLDELTGAGWREKRIGMESEIPLQHWHLNDPGVVPNLLQTGAGSPTGICVYEGRLLPERFWDQVIHCDAGPNIVRAYPVEKAGAGYTARIEPIMTGTTDKWFRPADVCVAPDGSLFVTDWYDPGVGGHRQEDVDRGRLFRIAPPGAKYVVPSFDYSTPEGAAEALKNPNLAVRYKAWMALHAMGAEAEGVLLKLWQDKNPRLKARALWLLGKIEGHAEEYVLAGLADENEDIRATAIRLARQTGVPITEVVSKVVNDPSFLVLREAAVALRFCNEPAVPELWAQLAMRYQANDRWYLEALGIGADLRASECFAAWLNLAGNDWDSPNGRDIVWRSRAPEAAEKLVEILRDPKLELPEVEKYFRAIEYHPAAVRTEALRGLLDLKNDDAAKRDSIIVLAAERMQDFDWRSNAVAKAAVEAHIRRATGTAAFLSLIKRFNPEGMESQVLELAENGDNSTGVEAVRLLLQSKDGRTLVEEKLADDQSAGKLASLLGLLGNQQATRLLTPLIEDAERAYDVRAAATRTLASNNLGAKVLMDLAENGSLPGDVKLLAAGILSRSQDAKVRTRAAEILPLPTRTDQAPLPPLDQLATMRGDVQRGMDVFRNKGTCANCHVVGQFGKEVGPNLSEIGDKLSREAMLISILDPSAGISHNYENYVCLMDSGQVVAGVMVSQTDEYVTLRTAEAIDRKIDREEIETLKKSEKSIMPENLHHGFDTQGLVDLVEYMMTLKKKS